MMTMRYWWLGFFSRLFPFLYPSSSGQYEWIWGRLHRSLLILCVVFYLPISLEKWIQTLGLRNDFVLCVVYARHQKCKTYSTYSPTLTSYWQWLHVQWPPFIHFMPLTLKRDALAFVLASLSLNFPSFVFTFSPRLISVLVLWRNANKAGGSGKKQNNKKWNKVKLHRPKPCPHTTLCNAVLLCTTMKIKSDFGRRLLWLLPMCYE